MLHPEMVRTYRAETQECLAEIRSLPGYVEAWEGLRATVPEGALKLRIAELRRIRDSGRVDVDTPRALRLLGRSIGYLDSPAAKAWVGYLERVDAFGGHIGDAQWSARAVHEALVAGREVGVPTSAPDPGWWMPETVTFPPTFKQGEIRSEEEISDAVALIQRALASLRSARPREGSSELAEQQIATAERALAYNGRGRLSEAERALFKSAIERWEPRLTSRLGAGRAAAWEAVVTRAEARLAGYQSMSEPRVAGARRRALQRARDYMNAAVNRTWDGPPLYQSDPPTVGARQGEHALERETAAYANALIRLQRLGAV